MKVQAPAESSVQDLQAVLLARIYRLILAWPDPSNQAASLNGDNEDVVSAAGSTPIEDITDEEAKI